MLDYAFPHLSAVPHKKVRVCMNACTVQGHTVICKEKHNLDAVTIFVKVAIDNFSIPPQPFLWYYYGHRCRIFTEDLQCL